MKTATFNINNVVRRLSNLLEWLRAAVPDVVCLQEPMTPGCCSPRSRRAAL
jgi:exodeoxyribonuclease-3